MEKKTAVAIILLSVLTLTVYGVIVDVWQTTNTVTVGHESLMLVDADTGSALTSIDWGNYYQTGQAKTIRFNLTVIGSNTVNIYWNATGLPSCFNLTLTTTNGNQWLPNTIIRKQPGETVQCTATLTLLNFQEGSYSFTVNFYAEKS